MGDDIADASLPARAVIRRHPPRFEGEAEEDRVVSESMAREAAISEQARRNGVRPLQLFGCPKGGRRRCLAVAEASAPLPDTTVPAITGETVSLNKERPAPIENRPQIPARDLSANALGSGSELILAILFRPSPRQQLVELLHRPAVHQRGEDVGQIGLRVQSMELCALNERGQTRPIASSSIP